MNHWEIATAVMALSFTGGACFVWALSRYLEGIHDWRLPALTSAAFTVIAVGVVVASAT